MARIAVGRGGVDVATQVGAGNAPLGGIVADGPIVVSRTAFRSKLCGFRRRKELYAVGRAGRFGIASQQI
jgi:hypothetical protein